MPDKPRHRVEIVRLESGEHLPLVVGPDGMPALFPNLWLLELRRRPSRAPQSQTLESYAYALALFEDFLLEAGIDVVVRHVDGGSFSRRDGANLAIALSRLSPAAAARRKRTDETRKLRYKLGLDERLPRPRRLDVVCGELASRRATVVCAYLVFLSDMLEHMSSPRATKDPAASPFGILQKALKATIKSVTQEGREALPDPVVKAIFETMLPSTPDRPNPENPFIPAVQYRNFVVVLLLSSSALRISEVIGLKLEDIDLGPQGPRLTVMRRPDDPDDKKRRKTPAKTARRTLDLPLTVASALSEWIHKHRNDTKRFGDIRKCPFVFLAFDDAGPHVAARQLSRSGADKIFRTLRASDVRFRPDVTAHRFRHTWVTRTWNKRIENGLDDPFFDELVAYFLGWTEHSQQARSYAKLAIRHQSGKFTLEWQDHITKDLKIESDAHDPG
jgi:integrase